MNRNLSLAFSLLALVAGMAMLAYASVPLYRMFCQVTGFGGTTKRAPAAPAHPSDRLMRVRFETDTSPELPWTFRPVQTEMTVRVGEQHMAFYTAKNLTPRALTGRAVYNVVPHEAGGYFVKIQCFCFTNQTLAPNQEVQMPVSFFIDPAILNDPDMENVRTITLSYTFFPATSSSSR